MIVTPDDVKRANEQSLAIAEASKRLIEPAQPAKSPLDRRFESAKRTRQK